jgi:hypothetical protein
VKRRWLCEFHSKFHSMRVGPRGSRARDLREAQAGGNRDASEAAARDPPDHGSLCLLPMVCAFLLMESLVGLQAWLAYRDNILTVSQMQAAGIGRGLPFVWHFGMWGDLGLVSPLISYLIGRYLERWRPWSMLLSSAIGFGAAGLLSWTYTFSDMPEAALTR